MTLQAAPPTVESVWPPVGQCGTQFQVKIVGADLAECRGILFYTPDIQCLQVEVLSDYEIRATVLVEKDCRIGNEPFRLFGSHGFSELRTLGVSPYPVIAVDAQASASPLDTDGTQLPAANAIARSARKVSLPSYDVTLCGILRDGAIDRFRVELKAGQRLTAEAVAVRLGKELLDTALSIVGPDGTALVHADDNSLFRQDPVATIIAPVSGVYTLEIHEWNYSGSENSFYALHVGGFAPPCVAYPAGGQLGSVQDIRFISTSSQVQRKVSLPRDEALLSRFQLFNADDQERTTSSVSFRLSELPNVLEEESGGGSNNQPSDLIASTLTPVALNGILEQPQDVDCFCIELRDQRPLRIEVFSQRIGSPVDSLLTVLNSSSQILASNDDCEAHDSRIDFLPPRPGKYFVCVTDKLAAGGPNYLYRIEVSHLKPDLAAFLPRPQRRSQQSQAISVPKGNRVLVRIGVQRQIVTSDVRLRFLDLPQGVQSREITIPSDRFWMPAVLEAASDAVPVAATLARVMAIGRHEGQDVVGHFEQVVDLVAESADQLFASASVSRLPVVVTSPLPFEVKITPPKAKLAINGSLDLQVAVQRDQGFDEPIRVELPFLPPWVVCEPFLTIPAGESEGYYRLQTTSQAMPGVWPMVATARVDTVSAKGDIDPIDGLEVASKIVDLSIDHGPIAGNCQEVAAEQGEELTAIVHLKHSGAAPSPMTAVLEGLPNRVTCQPKPVQSHDAQIAFRLSIPADAPVGESTNVRCRLTGSLNGEQVSYLVAEKSRLVIAPKGKLVRAGEGQLLSPLQALRHLRSSSDE